MTETWKPVKGYERLYEVSSFGRVKSLGRITKRKQGTRVVEIYKPEVVLSQLRGYIALAKQYNVTPELIRNIVRGKIWKRVCIL